MEGVRWRGGKERCKSIKCITRIMQGRLDHLWWFDSSCGVVRARHGYVVFNVTVGQMVMIVTVVSELRQASYSKLSNITNVCSTDAPYAVKNSNKRECAVECLRLATCEDFNHKNDNNECALFLHKPLFHSSIPGCAGFKASYDLSSLTDAKQYFGINGCSQLHCFPNNA